MEPIGIRTVKTDAFQMEYVCFGEGERALVILPGLSPQSVMLQAQAIAAAYAVFAPHRRVYLFDRRAALPEAYTVRDMARDTAAAMDALGLREADLFGVSQGGMVALCLAAGRAERVRRLVLASTACRTGPQTNEWMRRWRGYARRGDARALYAEFAGALFSERFLRENAALLAQVPALTAEECARFDRLAAAAEDVDLTDAADRVRCPALVLGAEADRVIPAQAMRALAGRLGAECFLYGEGYGHGVYDEAPDFKERILAFLLRP